MTKKAIIIVLGMTAVIAIIGFALDIYPFGCGGNIACLTMHDYHPPGCDEKGERFFLRKNKDMFFGELSIPDDTFYYLRATWQEETPTYIAISPIEIANYSNINLEDFVDKTVCIEGKYRYGLPTFLVDVKDLPAGMSEYGQVVADIEEIKIVEND